MNAFHRQSIGVAFHHIDERLSQIEAILNSVGAKSPFSTYAFDVGPMERNAIVGYASRLRERMWAAVQRLEIPPETHRTSAAWVIATTLMDVSITLAEIEPSRLRGYGRLDEESATVLSGILSDLDRLVNSLDAYLKRMMGGNMAERLARLETTPGNRKSIAKIDEIIARHGLVELRPLMDALVSRIESRDLEIAVFGRVSSGKSSLLNYLLGHPVLPVGVLPVTAALTRLYRSDDPHVVVRTEVSQPRRISIEEIPDYVTEEGNPGNRRRVIDVSIGFPSERLIDGVTLIDTPGVGSLATVGAAQTRAYLPRCDLGVVLIDAGSTLDQEDLVLLRAMYESAVPSMVLVSKCDLLAPEDRACVVDYIARQTRDRFGQEASVHLVSTRATDTALTDAWFDQHIRPIMLRHREELERSVQRKIGNLAELTHSLLEVQISRVRVGTTTHDEAVNAQAARQVLRESEGRIAAVAAIVTKPVEETVNDAVVAVIHEAATRIVAHRRRGDGVDGELRSTVLNAMAAEASEASRRLEETDSFLNDAARRLAAAVSMPLARLDTDQRFRLTPLPPSDETQLSDLRDARCWWFIAMWPAAAVWMIDRKLRKRSEAKIWSLIRDQRHALRRWIEGNLRRVTSSFEARIAPLRARLDAANAVEDPSVDNEQLQSDADYLRALIGNPVAGAAGASAQRSVDPPHVVSAGKGS